MSADFFIAFGVWVLLCAAVWACVNALRKRAKDGCYPPSQEERVNKIRAGYHAGGCCFCKEEGFVCPAVEEQKAKETLQEAIQKCPPSQADTNKMPARSATEVRNGLLGKAGHLPHVFAQLPRYFKSLSDADLRGLKGLSAPVMKLRKNELDRRSRIARRKAAKQMASRERGLRPLFDQDPSCNVEAALFKDPAFDTGADANGAPVRDGPRRWRWSYGAENPRTILVTGPHPESDGLVAVIDLRAQTMSSVYVETTQAFPRGTDIDERMDADYGAWKSRRA